MGHAARLNFRDGDLQAAGKLIILLVARTLNGPTALKGFQRQLGRSAPDQGFSNVLAPESRVGSFEFKGTFGRRQKCSVDHLDGPVVALLD